MKYEEEKELIKNLSLNLAVEMTARTGDMWRYYTSERMDYIFSPSAYLQINKPWNGYRVKIKSTLPQELQAPRGSESITCDLNRTPEAISADICRRLLNSAMQFLHDAKIYTHQRRKEKNIINLRKKILAELLPNNSAYNDKFYTTTPKAKENKNGKNNLWADTDYSGQVKIEVVLKIKDARELIKHIKEKY